MATYIYAPDLNVSLEFGWVVISNTIFSMLMMRRFF